MMDRRELLHRTAMLLGGAITASAASGILAGCVSTPVDPAEGPAKTGFLNSEEMRAISAMADQIIPATDTPGAIDAGVPNFIDRMVSGYYQPKEKEIIRAGLRQATTDAMEMRGKGFADLAPEDQVALMKEYDREAYTPRPTNSDPHFFRLVKELTVLGYGTSQAGATKLMNYNQNPGPFRGDVPYSEIGKVSAL
jgi:gluconate 2-dehydrogenase gamma chain